MADSPIEMLINVSVQCANCGAQGIGNCNCWVTLRCTSCGRTQSDERQPEYGDLKEVELVCPDCTPKQKRAAKKGAKR